MRQQVPPTARSAETVAAEATPRPPVPAAAEAATQFDAPSCGGAEAGPDASRAAGGAVGDPRPIGVFDSGVGGLTVVRALRRALPQEAIVYLGDTARVPYGLRSAEVVRRYASSCARFLLAEGAKMVVVACNTASAHALGALQAALPVPVVGVVEAGARRVAETLQHGHLGVLATAGTVDSGAYVRALAARAPALQVTQVACPMFVPLCEEGLVDHPAARLLAADYLAPLSGLAGGPRLDAVLLGCTHYPLLAPLLQDLLGPEVALLDSATSAAAEVARTLLSAGLCAAPGARPAPPLTLLATDVTARLSRVAEAFLGDAVPEVRLVDLPAAAGALDGPVRS